MRLSAEAGSRQRAPSRAGSAAASDVRRARVGDRGQRGLGSQRRSWAAVRKPVSPESKKQLYILGGGHTTALESLARAGLDGVFTRPAIPATRGR